MARFLGGVLYGASTSPAAFLTEDAAELTVLSGPGPPNNGLWFSSTRDGKNWEDVTDIRKEVSLIGLLPGSSSSGVYYHTRPYVFWTGIGEAGLWYSRGAKRTKSVGVVREIDDAEVDCGGEDMMKQGLMGVEGGEMMSEMRWMQGGQLSRRDWLKTVGKVFLAVIALVMVSVFWNVVL
ncbi:uncharacterized protein KY384_006751 [Bacidia gigantensis]|uniref:uncharacterized protein n=1 Tax=Bacidia gigantensis TaxID=2732470 RepID=UPI001D058744|nr:uncharacterized protein KY384_006751 [Bacidia gigantensis]KAG8527835.1 hypothetical protein KY384_006751 [Bacidia gigantensis]